MIDPDEVPLPEDAPDAEERRRRIRELRAPKSSNLVIVFFMFILVISFESECHFHGFVLRKVY